jgi:hypothetical protein
MQPLNDLLHLVKHENTKAFAIMGCQIRWQIAFFASIVTSLKARLT